MTTLGKRQVVECILWRWVNGDRYEVYKSWVDDGVNGHEIDVFDAQWGDFIDRWGDGLMELIEGAIEDEPEWLEKPAETEPAV